ncbi:MAG: AgmX/PglI C-terminal domain-containing protein, partial [Deltaproteobacteria bacterium]|nr:AgmX/PglI C-terminal domain-containing protein [Deltaproteobacteria bacterium]
ARAATTPAPAATPATVPDQGGKGKTGKTRFPDPGFGETKLGDRKPLDSKGPAAEVATVQAVLARYRQNRRAVDRCYRRALENDPGLRVSRAKLLVTVDDKGRTSAKTSGISDASMLICLQSMVRRWRFPKPKAAVNVDITLVFER